MPIRFRCVYCNQLLGISRRKAGTVVTCSNCEGQLIVPEPPEGDEATPAKEPVSAPKGSRREVFGGTELESGPSAAKDSMHTVSEGPVNPVPKPTPSAARKPAVEIRLSVAVVMVLGLAALAAAAAAFAAGLWLGRSMNH